MTTTRWLRFARQGAALALLAGCSGGASGPEAAATPDVPMAFDGAAITAADAAKPGPDAAPAADAAPDQTAAPDQPADDAGAEPDAAAADLVHPEDDVAVAADVTQAPETVPESDAAPQPDVAPGPDVAPDVPAAPDVPPAPDVVAAPDVAVAADTGAPAKPPVVRFAALGDTGKGNAEQNAVGAALAAKCKESGCDFVVLLGDNFYPSGVKSENDSQFVDKFETPYKDVAAPFYVVLGNHDYGGEGAGYELLKSEFYRKYSKKNPKFHYPTTFAEPAWDKVLQHVHFVGLDSNLMMYGLGGGQVSKYLPILTKSTATWKVAFAHHPYLSNGKHGNAGAYEGFPGIPIVSGDGVKKDYEALLCGRVDLIVTGHDHSRQWLQKSSKCPGAEFIVSGAGASTTEIKGKSLLFTPSPVHYADAGAEGFLWIEIDGKTLRGQFLDSAGKVTFERVFTKP